MTLAQLSKVAASYLEVTEADLTKNGVNLFLIAANNARKNAELLHNFEYTRISASLDIVGAAGGALSSATYLAGTATAGVKEIVNVTLTNSAGSRYPVSFTRSDIAIERERVEQNLDYNQSRYRSDADAVSIYGYSSVTQRGGNLYIYPLSPTDSQTSTIYIEGYGWLPDYVDADLLTSTPKDFLLQHGASYMQWETIIELNYFIKRFVPRQEGQLSAPERSRDVAWRNLLLWDSYSVDSHVTPA